MIVLGLLLIAGGIFMTYLSSHPYESNPAPTIEMPTASVTTDQPPDQPVAGLNGMPVSVQVLEAGIGVRVSPGYYNSKSGTWTLSNDRAYFVTMTTKPNTDKGNTFIYGHAFDNIFANLKKVKPGNIAIVTTDKNQRFVYRFRESHSVDTRDSSMFSYTGAPILTLQTCTGRFYQYRTHYIFDFVGVYNV